MRVRVLPCSGISLLFFEIYKGVFNVQEIWHSLNTGQPFIVPFRRTIYMAYKLWQDWLFYWFEICYWKQIQKNSEGNHSHVSFKVNNEPPAKYLKLKVHINICMETSFSENGKKQDQWIAVKALSFNHFLKGLFFNHFLKGHHS